MKRNHLGVAVAAITLLEIAGETLPLRPLHYVAKPLIMALLLWWAWSQRHRPGLARPGGTWLLVGGVFAGAGDTFLMFREWDLFVPGLLSFLVMQVCYVVAFQRSKSASMKSLTFAEQAPWCVGLAVYALWLLLLVRPHLPDATVFVGLFVYTLALTFMAIQAINWQMTAGRGQYPNVVIGALLFLLSDSILAVNKFVQPIQASSWLIMGTYAAAQYFIITGFLGQPVTKRVAEVV